MNAADYQALRDLRSRITDWHAGHLNITTAEEHLEDAIEEVIFAVTEILEDGNE